MNALHRDLETLAQQTEARLSQGVESDPHRLHFHLMPPVGWLNDPNGLCRCGEWVHVFYQYAPFDARGGVKLWGHYRSRDLLNWQMLPPALYPDQPWDIHGAYSGSALVEDGVIYLYYTGNVKHAGDFDYVKQGRGHNTALAICRDGITVQSKQLLMENRDYPANLTCHVRDPKVWKQDGRYYMVQGARTLENRGEILVFESADKLHWTHINTLATPEPFGYMWECPDLFELDGQWVLACSPQGLKSEQMRYQNVYACGYFPLYGDFRGAYTLGEFQEMDMGFDFYAPQTFEDGARRLLIGWMGMPDAPYTNPTVRFGWQHALSVPCELRWQDGKLLRTPARELQKLRGKETALEEAAIFDLEYAPKGEGGIAIRGVAVLKWDEEMFTLTLEGSGAGRTVRQARVGSVRSLRVLADASSLEIFINEGQTVLSTRYYPPADARGVVLHGAGQARLWQMCRMNVRA